MKKCLRNLALLLSATIFVTVFTACNAAGDEGSYVWVTSEIIEEISSPDDSEETVSNDKGTQSNEEPEKNNQVNSNDFLKSLRGTKINIYSALSGAPKRGTIVGDRYYANVEKISKKYGVTINFVSDYLSNEALLTSFVSGKPLVNVFTVAAYDINSYIKADAIASLDDAMKELGITFQEKWYDQNVKKAFNLNGKHYAWYSGSRSPYIIAYNKRLLETKRLEDPINLYKKGEWTYDKLETYMKTLREVSSDGTVTVSGLEMPSIPEFMNYLAHMNGGSLVNIKNGTVSLNVTNAKTQKGLDYFYKWYCQEKIASIRGDWEAACINFSKGSAAMVFSTKYVFDAMNSNGMKDAVGVVPFPKGPDADAKAPYMYEQTEAYMIPKACQSDAKKYLFVMNELNKLQYECREKDFSDEYKHLILDKNSYEIFRSLSLEDNIELSAFEISGMTWGDGSLWDMMARISNYNETPSTAYAATRVSMENRIKDNWKGIEFTSYLSQ